MLTLEQIQSANDREIVEVDVPEWDGTVGVQVMAGKNRSEFESFLIAKRDKTGQLKDTRGLRSHLLSQVLVDEDGNLLFDKKSMDLLEEKSGTVLDRLFQEAMEINGLTEESMEEVEKNS